MDTAFDAVVIGSGLSGLATAALLQRGGRRVVVVDGAASPGGRARSPLVGDRAMNLGPHALYLGGAAERVLARLGVGAPGFVPPASGGQFILDGALVPMPTTVIGLLTAHWLSWRERLQLAGMMRDLRGLARGDDARGSVASFLDRRAPSPALRKLLEVLLRLTTYTNAPHSLRADLALQQLDYAAGPRSQGVRYLDGGWQRLVDALSAHVDVRLGWAVRRVAPGEVTLEDGRRLTAPQVVLAVPLPTLAKLVDDAAVQARAQSAMPARAACLDVQLERLPVPGRRITLSLDAPLYFSVHSPPGATAPHLHVAEYRAVGDTSDDGLRARLEGVLDVAQPGWRGVTREARFLPSMTVMHDVPHDAPVTLAPGLWHVSDGLCPGFLLDAQLAQVERVVQALATESGKLRA